MYFVRTAGEKDLPKVRSLLVEPRDGSAPAT